MYIYIYVNISLVLLILLLVIININSQQLSKKYKTNDIHLEAPHLTDKFQDERPPIIPIKNFTRTRTKNKPKKIVPKDLINPCNGSYIKTNGTTCGLKEIMIGRCYEYEYVKRGFQLNNQT